MIRLLQQSWTAPSSTGLLLSSIASYYQALQSPYTAYRFTPFSAALLQCPVHFPTAQQVSGTL